LLYKITFEKENLDPDGNINWNFQSLEVIIGIVNVGVIKSWTCWFTIADILLPLYALIPTKIVWEVNCIIGTVHLSNGFPLDKLVIITLSICYGDGGDQI
jgi:hypothetical protein